MKQILCALLLLVSPAMLAEEPEKRLFDEPIEYFEAALLPSLSLSEAAEINTTLRGFHLRADSHPGFHEKYEPSEWGIYLNVAVRDPEEISAFKDATTTKEQITTRTVEFPAPKNEQVALRIVFAYGKEAPEKALEAIRASIKNIIVASGHETAGKQR